MREYVLMVCLIAVLFGLAASLSSVAPTLSAEFEPTATSTPPPAASVRKESGRIINDDGWRLPLPDGKKLLRERSEFGTTSAGERLPINISEYVPVKDYFYSSQTDEYPGLKGEAVGGLLKLLSIFELTRGEQVYGYTVFSAQAEKDEAGTPHRKGHMFFLRFYDSDGDGKFETMVTDSSPFLLPDWVKGQSQ